MGKGFFDVWVTIYGEDFTCWSSNMTTIKHVVEGVDFGGFGEVILLSTLVLAVAYVVGQIARGLASRRKGAGK